MVPLILAPMMALRTMDTSNQAPAITRMGFTSCNVCFKMLAVV